MSVINSTQPTVESVKPQKKAFGQTGPKTIRGKNRSKWNALKDGATAKSTVLPFEDERLYKRHILGVEEALNPTNYVEAQLVREYAEGLWRIIRHEKRSAYERDKILEKMTPAMVADTLGLDDRYITSAPDYLTNLKYKISVQETTKARHALVLFGHLMENAKGIANFQMVWAQYKDLFAALGAWLTVRSPKTTPILNTLGSGLNLAWQQNPKPFMQLLDQFSNHLFYVAYFESFKPQIRVWMESWFFLQRHEMRRLESDDLLLLKERNHTHGILDKLMRFRKSNVYLETVPAQVSLMASMPESENQKTK
jgi:hypothetical protein